MKLLIIVFGLALLMSCTKDNIEITSPHPSMDYIQLGDSVITFGKGASFDLDKNGQKDIYFTTFLIGDPILQQDKRQWVVGSSFYTSLPVNEAEAIPVLKYNDSIPVQSFSGYHWYNASNIVLAQKVIPVHHPSFWEGEWRSASHRYMPLQISRDGKWYNGWVEISFSIGEGKLVLHKAAVCKEAGRAIKAGN
jgi:hypothetical protein